MIVLHYVAPDGPRLAVRSDEGLFDAGIDFEQLIRGTQPKRGRRLDESRTTLAPAVPRPGKILCIGLNYRSHADEFGLALPENPIVFAKMPNTLSASDADIALPKISVQYDYEAELVAVIGRTARNVSEVDALDHVWGYCNGNDLSARDLQVQSSQWLIGKSLDGFGPVGPWVVSRDEAGDLSDMPIRCSVNGDIRQSSRVGDMIFGVPELVSFLSRHFTLDPGDIIFTGTPGGVAEGRPGQPWLAAGDVVEVEVGPLGRLVNHMVAGD